jgi:hypothetical protein
VLYSFNGIVKMLLKEGHELIWVVNEAFAGVEAETYIAVQRQHHENVEKSANVRTHWSNFCYFNDSPVESIFRSWNV